MNDAYTYDGDIYCAECLPEEVDIDHQEVHPVCSYDEWSYIPDCGKCGELHTYVTVIEDN